MTLIINYDRVADAAAAAAKLVDYTDSGGCGFTYAWIDPYDTTLVYHYASCPVEAVITALGPVISSFVTTAVAELTNLTAADSDRHLRILKVIDDVSKMTVDWLNDKNTTEEISQFLQSNTTLRNLIVTELITQGALA